MNAAAALSDLRRAMATAAPACVGDERFTADTSERDPELAEICRGCPLRDACREYARLAPMSALWGYYGGIPRRRKTFHRDRRRVSEQ